MKYLILLLSFLLSNFGIQISAAALLAAEKAAVILDEEDTVMTPVAPQTIGILQPEVIRQNEATCGYHALKNGILIARAILSGTNPEKELMDKSHVDKLFADQRGLWRAFCIKNKLIANGAIPYIKLILTSCLNQRILANPNEQSAITQIIDGAAIELAKRHIEQNGNIQFSLNKEIIYQILSKDAQNKFETSAAPVYLQLAQAEKISALFESLVSIEFNIKDGRILDSSNKAFEIIKDADGNWITGDSLDKLAALERSKPDSLFNGHDIPVYVIESGTTSATHGQIDSFNQFMKAISEINTNACAIFLINKSLGSMRHWVTCVVNKVAGKSPNYILADSLGAELCNDSTILGFIKFIEQRDIKCINQIRSNNNIVKIKKEVDALFNRISKLDLAKLKIDKAFLESSANLLACGGSVEADEKDQNQFLTDFRKISSDNKQANFLLDLKKQFTAILEKFENSNEAAVKILKNKIEMINTNISINMEQKDALIIEIRRFRTVAAKDDLATQVKLLLNGVTRTIDAFNNWDGENILTKSTIKSISESCSLDATILNRLVNSLDGYGFTKNQIISKLKEYRTTVENSYQKYLPQLKKSQEVIEAKEKQLAELEDKLKKLMEEKAALENELSNLG